MKIEAKKIIVVGVQLLVVLGFLIGADWASERFHRFFHSYYADIALPLGFYFLLTLSEENYSFLRPWYGKATTVFLLVSTSELLQFFDIYAFGRVFDPFDFVAYMSGVLCAAVLDRLLLRKVFSFWK